MCCIIIPVCVNVGIYMCTLYVHVIVAALYVTNFCWSDKGGL